MNLCDEKTIRELLGRHGFHFSKSMGQNFLIDPQIPADIAAASGADETCGVLEIGPGIGPLTAELAQRAGKVAAVELDLSLLPVLSETMSPYPNVEIVPGDVMKLDLTALAEEKFQNLTPLVCANLPYNITTPVLTRLIEAPCIVHRAHPAGGGPTTGFPTWFQGQRFFFALFAILYGGGAALPGPQGKISSSAQGDIRRAAVCPAAQAGGCRE